MVVGFLGCCGAIRESQLLLTAVSTDIKTQITPKIQVKLCITGKHFIFQFFIFLFLIFAVLVVFGVWAILSKDTVKNISDDVHVRTVTVDIKSWIAPLYLFHCADVLKSHQRFIGFIEKLLQEKISANANDACTETGLTSDDAPLQRRTDPIASCAFSLNVAAPTKASRTTRVSRTRCKSASSNTSLRWVTQMSQNIELEIR